MEDNPHLKKKNQRLKRSAVFFLISCLIPLKSFADWPFIANGPEPIDYGHWQLSFFASLIKNKTSDDDPDLYAPAIEFDYGALPNVELHLIAPYAWALPPAAPTASGLGDLEAGVEYRFIQETTNFPQVGIFPLLELPTGDANRNLGNGKMWVRLPIWLQKSWDSWTTYGGGGYAINSAKDMRNYPYAAWLLQKEVNRQITLGAELFAQGAESVESQAFTGINMGGSYNFTEHLSASFSAGHSLLGESQLIAYLDLAWQQ